MAKAIWVTNMGRLIRERQPSNCSARSVICIRTEGKNTEPIYFAELLKEKHISRSRINCKASKGSSPVSVVNDLVKAKERNACEVKKGKAKIDEYWTVFDTEGGRPGLEEAIRLAKKHDIHCVISAPSFEYWILLHYEKTSRAFVRCDEIENILTRLVPGGYSKSGYNAKDVLSRLPEAKRNIDSIRRELGERSMTELPNTNVDELIASIEGDFQ